MAQYSVKVEGLDELQKRFGTAGEVIQRETKRAMEASVVTVHDRAATYPPQRPTPYVRTGTFGRSFSHRVESIGGDVRGIVSNPVSYASYVRGDPQAWMHVGYWATMRQIVEQKADQIAGFFADAMRKLAEHLGD